MKRAVLFLFLTSGCAALEHELARAPEPWMTCQWAIANDANRNAVNRLGGSPIRWHFADVFCHRHVDPTALPLPIDLRRVEPLPGRP